MPQLTARRPFVVKKWPFKALFSHPRLADTELAVTSSYRHIEALPLVFGGIQKKLTRPLRERSFWGRFIPTPR